MHRRVAAVAHAADTENGCTLPCHMTRPAAYLWGVNALGTACIVLSVFNLVKSPISLAWLIPAGLAIVSGLTVLRMQSVSASFSIGDTFSFAALFVYGPEAATVTVALDTLAISTRLKGTPGRVIFNTAAPSLAMWSAGTLVFRVAGLPLPVQSGGVTSAFMAAGAAVRHFVRPGQRLRGDGGRAPRASVDLAGLATAFRQAVDRSRGRRLCRCAGRALHGSTGDRRAHCRAADSPAPLSRAAQLARTRRGRVPSPARNEANVPRHGRGLRHRRRCEGSRDRRPYRRVQAYCAALAREFGIADEPTLRALEAAALLHDVGKIGIPEHILNKPGKLTTEEYDVMKGHVAIGAEILSGIDFPFPVVPIVKSHHENWDGTGYPAGLRGEEIPLAARILTVVDCFDALTSDRPYRGAMSTAEAFGILQARRGTMYDPQVVDRFIRPAAAARGDPPAPRAGRWSAGRRPLPLPRRVPFRHSAEPIRTSTTQVVDSAHLPAQTAAGVPDRDMRHWTDRTQEANKVL